MDIYKFNENIPRLFFTKNVKSIEKQKIYSKILSEDFDPIEIPAFSAALEYAKRNNTYLI